MRVHPVFHNSLLKPYKETDAHGPNFEKPPPVIIAGEEGHYEIEKILQARPTRNRKSTQYLIKWKGYPDSDNTWLPAKELTHAKDLLEQFTKTPSTVSALQEQRGPKEGILSRAKLATSQTSPQAAISRAVPALKPSYSQVARMNQGARDRGTSHVIPQPQAPRDRGRIHVTSTRDPGNLHVSQHQELARDLARDHIGSRDTTRSHDQTRYGRATRPLIGTWKTVGIRDKHNPVRSTAQHCAASLGTPTYS